MSRRVLASGYKLSRYPLEIGRYTMATHTKDQANPLRFKLLMGTDNRMRRDGLNSLKYQVRELCKLKLFTRIEVYYDQEELMKNFNETIRFNLI